MSRSAPDSELIVCNPATLATEADLRNFFAKIRGGGNVSLGTIDLSNKNLRGLALDLVVAVGENKNVSHLILNNTGIELDVILQIAEALKTNTALTRLSLTDNNLLDAGVNALAGMLEINKTLVQIDVDRTHSDVRTQTALDEKLAENAKAAGRSTLNPAIIDNARRGLPRPAPTRSIGGVGRSRAEATPPPDFVSDRGEGEDFPEAAAGEAFSLDVDEEELRKLQEKTKWVENTARPPQKKSAFSAVLPSGRGK